MNIAELFIRLSADTSSLKKGMADAGSTMDRAAKAMQGAGRTMAAGITAPILAIGAAALGSVIRVGKLADEMLDLVDQTGLSTDTLQEFRHVAMVAGVGPDTLATAAIKLTTALSGSGAESATLQNALGALGVAFRDANGALIPMDQLLPSIITGLQGQADQTQRNALAADIFGRSWAELAPVLALGADGFADARARAHELGLVLSTEALESADAFRVKWDTLKASLGASASQIGVELIPAMTALANLVMEHVVPAVQALVGFTGQMIARWEALNPATQAFLTIALGLAAALGPVLVVGGKILTMVLALNPVTVAAVAAFAALVAAGVAITENWNVLSYEAQRLMDKVQAIGDKFRWLYDVTVGHSYVPDMVDAVGQEFGRMGNIFGQGLDAIVGFATGAGGSINDFVQRAIQDIARLLIKMAIFGALKAAVFGGVFGGGAFAHGLLGMLEGRASGGPVRAGGAYMVGERGPEVFVPSSSGSIVPHGGGSAAIMNMLPLPRPMTPREASRDAWHREFIRHLIDDNRERG